MKNRKVSQILAKYGKSMERRITLWERILILFQKRKYEHTTLAEVECRKLTSFYTKIWGTIEKADSFDNISELVKKWKAIERDCKRLREDTDPSQELLKLRGSGENDLSDECIRSRRAREHRSSPNISKKLDELDKLERQQTDMSYTLIETLNISQRLIELCANVCRNAEKRTERKIALILRDKKTEAGKRDKDEIYTISSLETASGTESKSKESIPEDINKYRCYRSKFYIDQLIAAEAIIKEENIDVQ